MEALEPRRCGATSKGTGMPCGRAPVAGGMVCALHGGRAPAAMAAAKLRLLEAVEPAIARLVRFIEAPPGLCTTCGRCDDTGAIVSAIRTVLDRCGFGPTAALQVTAAPRNRFDGMSLDAVIERSEHVLARLREMRDEEARQMPDSIDATIVEDDDAVDI